jgi:simple sugar transport system substrate-binding protein
MRGMLRLALAGAAALTLVTGFAQAEGLKEAKDVRIAFVVHGSPSQSILVRGQARCR